MHKRGLHQNLGPGRFVGGGSKRTIPRNVVGEKSTCLGPLCLRLYVTRKYSRVENADVAVK